MRRHLLSIDDLSRDDIERILGRAESFAEVSGREIKKVPTLRGRTVINLFYEASTRTSSSFELAAKRLSADLVSVKSSGSAVDKGESLKDTVQTLSAYDPAAIVIRSPHAGRRRAGRALDARLGDQRRRRQARAPHPGAARPLHAAAPRRLARGAAGLDRRRRAAQPRGALGHPRLLAHGLRGHGLRPADADPARDRVARLPGAHHARRAGEADVVYALRMQHERMDGSFVPSLREYAAQYQIDGRRLRPNQLLMHPGPVNRGVELAAEVIDSPQALIVEQVESGVVVRMAVLYELLAGHGAPSGVPRGAPTTEPQPA